MLRLLLVLSACLCLGGGVAEGQVLPFCENALPPGEGFGGTVTITKDCVWRPQLHFITSLNGQQGDFAGPLEVPAIYYSPTAPVTWQSGAAQRAHVDLSVERGCGVVTAAGSMKDTRRLSRAGSDAVSRIHPS